MATVTADELAKKWGGLRVPDPVAEDPAVSGGEAEFQSWYANLAKKLNLNPNPDDPRHFYDYRAAHRAGAEPDSTGHWPSQFKLEGHPRMIIDGVNTKTGERVDSQRTDPVDALTQKYGGVVAPADTLSAPPEAMAIPHKNSGGNPIMDFIGELSALNPVAQGKAIYEGSQAISEAAQGRPQQAIGMAKGTLNAQDQVRQEALEAFKKGDPATGVTKLVAWMIPILGPQINRAGNLLNEGQVAKGLGASVDTGLQVAGPKLVEGAVNAGRATKAAVLKGESEELLTSALNPRGYDAKLKAQRAIPYIQKNRIVGTAEEIERKAIATNKRAGKVIAGARRPFDKDVYDRTPLMSAIEDRKKGMTVDRPGGPVVLNEPAYRSLTNEQSKIQDLGAKTTVGEANKLRQNLDKKIAYDKRVTKVSDEEMEFVANFLRKDIGDNYVKDIHGANRVFKRANEVFGRTADIKSLARDMRVNKKPPIRRDTLDVMEHPGQHVAFGATGAAVGGAIGGFPGAALGAAAGKIIGGEIMFRVRRARSSVLWQTTESAKKIKLANALLSGDKPSALKILSDIEAKTAAVSKSSESDNVSRLRRSK